MPSAIVDVYDRFGQRVATYPLVLVDSTDEPLDDAFRREALRLARSDHAAPDTELDFLIPKLRPPTLL